MVEKFEKILREITKEKGEVVFFGLFKMDEITNKWSVLLAADWISEESRDQCFFLVKKIILENLSNADTSAIARIGIFESTDHLIKLLLNFKTGSNILNQQINGNIIHEGVVLASNKELTEQETLFEQII